MPWERGEDDGEEEGKGLRKKRAKAPTLAELAIEDSELKRLRLLGMEMRERLSVPKAGVTQAVLEKIHQEWRKSELVRLKFHEDLAHNRKMAHQIVEADAQTSSFKSQSKQCSLFYALVGLQDALK
ncbi:hypothetical protein AAC387_Pa12g1783 [Persea americana]